MPREGRHRSASSQKRSETAHGQPNILLGKLRGFDGLQEMSGAAGGVEPELDDEERTTGNDVRSVEDGPLKGDDVAPDGGGGDCELLGDLPVGQADGERSPDLLLACRERFTDVVAGQEPKLFVGARRHFHPPRLYASGLFDGAPWTV